MEADVVVVGLGYTGLPMAVAATRAGCKVIGLDEASRVAEIIAGAWGCGRTTVSEDELATLLAGPLHVQTGPGPEAGVHVLCVPSRDLLGALDSVAGSLRDGDLVIVQSTCPPGMIERAVIPRLGRRTSARVHVVHSPVRITPGPNAATDVPRVVAGATPECLSAGMRFLREIGQEVVPVSSIRTAELSKVFENTFRLVNIALSHELASLCGQLGVDTAEVLDIADTKPFGFLRHDPGPGAGGDCIPVCAEFFADAARRLKNPARIVEAAIEVNDGTPDDLVRQLACRGLRVIVAGVTYKPDVPDMRRSAALRIVEALRNQAFVGYHDPYVPRLRLVDGTVLRSQPVEPGVADLVLLVTKHSEMDVRGFRAPILDCSTGYPSVVEDRDA
jgi:UDP-N-acetyl-D-glucosamine dehydrogenase